MMSLDPLIRRFSMICGILSIIGVLIGLIGLGTNYWTMDSLNKIRLNLVNNDTNNEIKIDDETYSKWNVSYYSEEFFRSFEIFYLFRVFFRIVHNMK